MTLNPGSKTSPREPDIDILPPPDFPRPRDVNFHSDGPVDNVYGGARVAPTEREVAVNSHNSFQRRG